MSQDLPKFQKDHDGRGAGDDSIWSHEPEAKRLQSAFCILVTATLPLLACGGTKLKEEKPSTRYSDKTAQITIDKLDEVFGPLTTSSPSIHISGSVDEKFEKKEIVRALIKDTANNDRCYSPSSGTFGANCGQWINLPISDSRKWSIDVPVSAFGEETSFVFMVNLLGQNGLTLAQNQRQSKWDTKPPKGDFTFRGDKKATNNVKVGLLLADKEDASALQIAEEKGGQCPNGDWSDHFPGTPETFLLSIGDGKKVVCLRGRDRAMNVGEFYKGKIELDMTPPEKPQPDIESGTINIASQFEKIGFTNIEEGAEVVYTVTTDGSDPEAPNPKASKLYQPQEADILKEELQKKAGASKNTDASKTTSNNSNPTGKSVLYDKTKGIPSDSFSDALKIKAIQIDHVGNVSEVATLSYEFDSEPPKSFSISKIITPTTDTKPKFEWNGTTGDGTFHFTLASDSECKSVVIDEPKLEVTAYTLSTPLADGTYYICVSATDASGNIRRATNSGSASIVIDTTPPPEFVITGPTATNDQTPTISWEKADTAVSYNIAISAVSTCENPVATGEKITENNYAVTSSLNDGTYFVCVSAFDSLDNKRIATNSSELAITTGGTPFQFKIDTVPPGAFSIATMSTPTNNKKPQVSWAASAGASSYRIRLISAGTCAAPTTVAHTGNNITQLNYTPNSNLSDGTYTVCVDSKDDAGNGTTATNNDAVSFTIDSTIPNAPTVSISDGDGYLLSAESTTGVPVTITGTTGLTYSISLVNGTIDESPTGTLTSGSTTVTLHAVTSGSVSISATVTNSAGSTSPAGSDSTIADFVAPTAPTVQINDGPDNNINIAENTATIAVVITGEPSASYTIVPSNATILPGLSGNLNASGQASVSLTAQASGAVSVAVTLTDVAGNIGTSGSDTSTADLIAPAAPTVTISDGDGFLGITESTNGVNVAISGEAGTTYLINLTNGTIDSPSGQVQSTSGTLTGGSTNVTLHGTANGSVNVSVTLTDAAGNSGTAGSDSTIADFAAPATPTITINDGDGKINATENSAGVTATITGEAGTTYNLSPSNATVTGGNTGILTGGSVNVTIRADGAGAVLLIVTLSDSSGNSSNQALDSSSADLTAPSTPTASIADGDGFISVPENTTGVALTITGESGVSYLVTPTNGTIDQGNGGTLTGGSVTLTLHAVASGIVSVSVVTSDSAGNNSAAATDSSSADLTAPTGASALTTAADSSTGPSTSYDNDTDIFFAWTAGSDSGSGVRDYTVRYYGQAACGGTATSVTGVTANYLAFTGTDGGTYSFDVQTYDNVGNVTSSTCSGSITIDSVAPTSASSLITAADSAGGPNVNYDNDTTIYFAWTKGTDSGSGFLNQTISYFTQANCTGTPTSIAAITGASTSVVGINGTTYSFEVNTFDAAGNSTLSPCSGSIIIDTTNPGTAMSLITPANSSGGPNASYDTDGTIYFAWLAGTETGSGIRDYTVSYYSSTNCGGTPTNVTGITNTYYSVTGIDGETYSYLITTYDNAGNSSGISSCSTNITIDLTPPAAFSALTPSTLQTSDTPTITWAASSGATSWDLYLDSESSCTAPFVTSQSYTGLIATSKSVTTALADGTYFVCIFAYDIAGNMTAASTNTSFSFEVESSTIHTSFVTFSAGTYGLKYAKRTGNSWSIETITSGTDIIDTTTSLALDSNNAPYVSYALKVSGYNQLKYSERTNGVSWTAYSALDPGDALDDIGLHNSIALDKDDRAMITYLFFDASANANAGANLVRAIDNGSGFPTTLNTLTNTSGIKDTMVAWDSQLTANVAHMIGTYRSAGGPWTLLYRTNATSWGAGINEIPGNLPDTSLCDDYLYAAIALDSNQKPHITYLCHETTGDVCHIFYANKTSGSWNHTQLGTTVASGCQSLLRDGLRPTIALDSANSAHVAWLEDGASPKIMYSNNVTGSWATPVMVGDASAGTGGTPGGQTMTLDDDNLPYIIYMNKGGALKMTSKNSGAWITESITGSGVIGVGSGATSYVKGRSNH